MPTILNERSVGYKLYARHTHKKPEPSEISNCLYTGAAPV